MLWGYSPAQDVVGLLMETNSDLVETSERINVLLVGCSDPRHILMTIAKYYTHNVQVVVHFYVAEVLLDFIARDLLLLILALEPSSKVPLSQKTLLWMELFGNALVRPKTMEYLFEKSEQLVHIVTDTNFNEFRLPCVDLTDLKYKERDNLEFCFRYWTRNEFNIGKHWDARLRTKLGSRYDSRNGVFEWDYFMKMKDKHKQLLVNSNEYNQWRRNGVAFVWLETEYSLSNPTFAMGVHTTGDQLSDSGCFVDMEIGPYFTFGTTCEDEAMLEKNHHVNLHRATDVFERNLTRCFYEIERQRPYVHDGPEGRHLGQITLKINELDTNPTPRLEADAPKMKENYSSIPVKHKIHFLNTKSVENLPNKIKFENFFDVILVAQTMEKILLKSDHHKRFFKMAKNEGVVAWETRKAMLDISKEGLKSFEDAVSSMMSENACQPIGDQNFDNNFFVKYKVKR